MSNGFSHPPSGPRMGLRLSLGRPLVVVFLLVVVIAAGFALYTNHVWEDFYITYRSSKHLATGQGLVHNVGERVHSFTSPLGVLLPAGASLLTFNSSDTAALWIFRGMAIVALGAGVALLYATMRRLEYPLFALVFLAACLATDAKIIDFTINGMETAFVIAFFAYAFWAMYAGGARRWIHLGLAWAGLMWSRPDGCITIALLTAGVWLFNDPARTGLSRREWFPVIFRAALLTTVLYLPWFVFAWSYYGSPVPHTIAAKSLLSGPKTLGGFWLSLLGFTHQFNSPYHAIDGVFNPAQTLFGGWPDGPRLVARTVAAVCSLLWLLRPLRRDVRALSFTFFGLCVYLNYFPPYSAAWYLVLPSAVAFAALAGTVGQLLETRLATARAWLAPALRWAVIVAAVAFVAQGCWFTYESARQLKAQQALIETGIRRVIGEWLREQSSPGDTVFMEPLGYIGFFSGLRTYDYPGLSSPEVVAAIKRHGKKYPPLIRELKPSWLVLRPSEINEIHAEDPALLQVYYSPAKTFDRRKEIAELDVRGLGYLHYDAAFMVFKRRP